MKRTRPPEGKKVLSIHEASVLLARARLAALLGMQYGTDRNVYEALGYKETVRFSDYASRYLRQDIARAIIDRPVSYTWRGPLVIGEAGDDQETKLEKAWKELEDHHSLKSKFVRLDKLSSIGFYGVLLLGFDDTPQVSDFKKPVSRTPKLLYVKPLSSDVAKIASYVKDSKDPRYGLVETYDIEYNNPGSDSDMTKMRVHHTRCIHVIPNMLQSEVEGTPVLQPVYNRLMDLEKLVGGSAEMFWRGARPGYQGVLKDDYTISPNEEDKLQEKLAEYEHNLRRFIMTEGYELKDLAPQISDPSKHVDVIIQMISAQTGIPKRILTGSERGELSSQQDITSWYATIQTRREEYAEPTIIRPFVDRMIELGILPEASTGEYFVDWQDLYSESDKDKAEVGKTRAEAIKSYAQNLLAQEIVSPDAFLKWFLGLDPDDVEQIMEMTDAYISDMIEEEQRLAEEAEEEEVSDGGTEETEENV